MAPSATCASPRALMPQVPFSTVNLKSGESGKSPSSPSSVSSHNVHGAFNDFGRSALFGVNTAAWASPFAPGTTNLILSPVRTLIVDTHDFATPPSQKWSSSVSDPPGVKISFSRASMTWVTGAAGAAADAGRDVMSGNAAVAAPRPASATLRIAISSVCSHQPWLKGEGTEAVVTDLWAGRPEVR